MKLLSLILEQQNNIQTLTARGLQTSQDSNESGSILHMFDLLYVRTLYIKINTSQFMHLMIHFYLFHAE